MKYLDFEAIKNLGIRVSDMYAWTEQVWTEQDSFICPPKSKMWLGESGRFMIMPSVLPDYDLAGIKFICRNVDDEQGLPLRNSNIMLQNNSKHGLLAVLDGTYITTMRTGSCAAYNAITFQKENPTSLAVYGLGQAARAFLLFYVTAYNKPVHVKVLRYKDQADSFIRDFSKFSNLTFTVCDTLEELLGDSDVIVSCISFAHEIIGDVSLYKEGCTIVPVHTAGFQNCDLEFDKVFVDDIGHVQGYRYFNEFKSKMFRISDVVTGKTHGRTDEKERIIVYNGGLAIFDMFFAMKILEVYNDQLQDLPSSYPKDRFWMSEVISNIEL